MGTVTTKEPIQESWNTIPTFPLFGIPDKSNSRPFTILQSKLSEDLLNYLLLETPFFNCQEEEIEEYGFKNCIDYPLDHHVYYEGYFHSKETGDTVFSLNPRYGYDFDKPAAPEVIRAFCMAYRESNKDWIEELSVVLIEQENGCCDFIAGLIEKGNHFSDLAVQIHYGDEVKGQYLGWHSDAVNSSLHCAVSIKNSRVLHLKASVDGAEKDIYHIPQSAGEMYLSSPWSFAHAVQYPATKSWKTRIMAIQMRFLMTSDEYQTYKTFEPEDHFKMQETITNILQNNEMISPSLSLVQKYHAQITNTN